jgi:hypothetical protein
MVTLFKTYTGLINWNKLRKVHLVGLYTEEYNDARSRECEISSKWVMSPQQGKSVGRSAPFCNWTGMFWDGNLIKQIYRCDSVVIASFVGTGYTASR